MKHLTNILKSVSFFIILTAFSFTFKNSFSQHQISHYNFSCGASGQDYGRSIINRIDKGYAIAGYTYQNPSCIGSYDWSFLKLRQDGTIDCSRVLGSAQDDKCFSVIQTNLDSGYFLTGYTSNINSPFKKKATIMKLDKNCNLMVSRCTFDSLNSSYNQIVIDPANVMGLAGYMESNITVGFNRNKILATQYNAAGAMNWSSVYVGGGLSKEEATSICFQPVSGVYGLAVKTNFFSGNANVYDIMIVKLSYAGAVIWKKVYRFQLPASNFYPNSEPKKIIPMTDGGFVVVGSTNTYSSNQRDVVVLRVNSAGGVVWSRTYGTTGLIEEGESIVLDGTNLVIAGTQRVASPLGSPNAFIMKISTAGGPAQWRRIWDAGNPTDAGYDLVNSITGTTVAGYAVTGHTIRAGVNSDPFLWRVNSTGNVSGATCNDSMTTPYINNVHKLDSFNLARIQRLDITRGVTQVNPPTTRTVLCLGTSSAPAEGNEDSDKKDVVKYSLKQNSPNPFNPATTINFELPSSAFTTIKVYDISGRLVSTLINEFKEAGSHNVLFNAAELSSGVYYYKLESEGFTDIKKMILLK
ncbi:MAG: T9SS type A sorting domain-containing protein [bacterium]|nr:T9SS type A sorting domain-containing protein [bacterium]